MTYAIGKLKMLMCLRIKIACLVVILFSFHPVKHDAVFREVPPSESGVDFNNNLLTPILLLCWILNTCSMAPVLHYVILITTAAGYFIYGQHGSCKALSQQRQFKV
jgi:hypothetical protein